MSYNPRARCLMQLEKKDIRLGKIHRNLSVPSLIEIAICRKEGNLSSTGAFSVKTGISLFSFRIGGLADILHLCLQQKTGYYLCLPYLLPEDQDISEHIQLLTL